MTLVSRSAAPHLTAPCGFPSRGNPAFSLVLSVPYRSWSASVLRCSSALSRTSSRRSSLVVPSRPRPALPFAPAVFVRSRLFLRIAPRLCPAICCSLQPRAFLSVFAGWCSPSPGLVLLSFSFPRSAAPPLPAPCGFPRLCPAAHSQGLSLSCRSCSAYSGSVLRHLSARSQAPSRRSFQIVPSRPRSELPFFGSGQPAPVASLASSFARSCPGPTPRPAIGLPVLPVLPVLDVPFAARQLAFTAAHCCPGRTRICSGHSSNSLEPFRARAIFASRRSHRS